MRNQVRFLKEGGLRTGAFGTQGCLGQFRMEGDALLEEGEGQIQIFPHFDVVWFEDKAGGFTDDQETRVSGQTLRRTEFVLRTDFEFLIPGRQDLVFTGRS